jgi:hypothetical protein
MADKIMLIRHAEKPDVLPPNFGVDEAGQQDPDELVVRGWQQHCGACLVFSPGRAMPRSRLLRGMPPSRDLRNGCRPAPPQPQPAPAARHGGTIFRCAPADRSIRMRDFAVGDEANLADSGEGRTRREMLIATVHPREESWLSPMRSSAMTTTLSANLR